MSGLSRESYVSSEIFDLELEKIFARTWQYAGHVSQLRETGSFVRLAVGTADVVVLGDGAGGIHAVHNVCRHRGALLLDAPAGVCGRVLTCGYHGWTYRHDGSLQGAPGMGPTLALDDFGLRRAHVEVWNGLVFVHLGSGTPTPVHRSLADVSWPMADLDQAVIAQVNHYDVDANWKVAWENALECYHCAINHPELLRVFDPLGDPGSLLLAEDYVYFRTPLKPGAVSLTATGRLESAVTFVLRSPLEQARGFLQWHPSAFEMIASPDHVALMTYLPLSPERTRITQTFLVPTTARAGDDFDSESLFGVHTLARRQDNVICEAVQRGVRNPAYTPGPFHPVHEQENLRFHAAYRRLLDRCGDNPRP